MKNNFVVISSAGPNRDFSKDTREQPFWGEHAAFIDALVDEGFILMGGPLVDEGGSLMIVILNAGAGKVAKAGNLQSMIAGLFTAEGLNAEIISVAGKDVSAAAKQA